MAELEMYVLVCKVSVCKLVFKVEKRANMAAVTSRDNALLPTSETTQPARGKLRWKQLSTP